MGLMGSDHDKRLNADPDLSAFARINPCGYEGLEVTSLKQLGVEMEVDTASRAVADKLIRSLSP